MPGTGNESQRILYAAGRRPVLHPCLTNLTNPASISQDLLRSILEDCNVRKPARRRNQENRKKERETSCSVSEATGRRRLPFRVSVFHFPSSLSRLTSSFFDEFFLPSAWPFSEGSLRLGLTFEGGVECNEGARAVAVPAVAHLSPEAAFREPNWAHVRGSSCGRHPSRNGRLARFRAYGDGRLPCARAPCARSDSCRRGTPCADGCSSAHR